MFFFIHPLREELKKNVNISCVEKVESWRQVCVCDPSPECEGKVP